jgi:hypothetical protein
VTICDKNIPGFARFTLVIANMRSVSGVPAAGTPLRSAKNSLPVPGPSVSREADRRAHRDQPETPAATAASLPTRTNRFRSVSFWAALTAPSHIICHW